VVGYFDVGRDGEMEQWVGLFVFDVCLCLMMGGSQFMMW